MPVVDISEARLYAIIDADYLGGRSPAFYAEEIVAGGADIVQVRAKGRSADEIVAMGQEILEALDGAIPLIVNDYPELVAKIGAQGVHIGQEDGEASAVRAIVGPDVLIGRSTHSLEQLMAAGEEDVDYVGFGPIYATPTKPDYQPVGTHDIGEAEYSMNLPIFCIGGIKMENIKAVSEAGARRVCVVSGILQAESPAQYCRGLKQRLLSVHP